MKTLKEIIIEKLYISKSSSKSKTNYDTEELNTKIFDFDDALKTFDNYFNDEHGNIIKHRGFVPIKKGVYSSSNRVTCTELTSYEIGEYVLWVGSYDYGLVFSPSIKRKLGDNDLIDMLCDTEVANHYLYGDNFLEWLNKVNIKHLNDIFKV
jgi:hypothetical protein